MASPTARRHWAIPRDAWRSRVAQLLAAALDDGILTLKMDGIEKVPCGITDIKMVRSVGIK